MKTFLMTAAAVLALSAGAASALDFGNGIALDNEVYAAYEVNAETTTLEYTANLNYVFAEGAVVYAETTVDIQDIAYDGVQLGMTYQLPVEADIELGAYATYDADWNNDAVVLEATLRF